MPTLFRRKALEPPTKEQVEKKLQVVADAKSAVDAYEKLLKAAPKDTRLYAKKDKLLQLRSKELIKLSTQRSYQESERIKKLEAFTASLQEALKLLEDLNAFREAVYNPDNDLADKEPFINHPDKLIRETAKQFIPKANDAYKRASALAYTLLREDNLHHGAKDKEGFSLAARVIQHASEAIKKPQEVAKINALLRETKTLLSKHLKANPWRLFGAAMAVFGGLCVYAAGVGMMATGVLFPLAVAACAVGLSIYAAGLYFLLNESLPEEKFQVNAMVSQLNHLIGQANKLFPKKPVQELELTTLRGDSVPAHSPRRQSAS